MPNDSKIPRQNQLPGRIFSPAGDGLWGYYSKNTRQNCQQLMNFFAHYEKSRPAAADKRKGCNENFYRYSLLSDFVQGFLYSLRFLSEGTILQKASGFCVWIFAVGLTLFSEGTILQRNWVFAGFLLREPSSKRLFVDWLLPGSILTSLQTVALLRSAPDHQGN